MAGKHDDAVAAGNYQPDHAVGKWYSVPDLRLRDHGFTVPLDYSTDLSAASASPKNKISIFAREVVAVGKEELPLPYLLYLQGGPGFECPRPTEAGGWIQKACQEFRLVLMDQRGTGLSTPLTYSSLLQFKSAQDLADYVKHFRADNIVNDAEFIRVRLVPDAGTWTVLGQSYGGFCAVTYLSFAQEGLKQVLLTGGIPPIQNGSTADAVSRACFEQVILQNEKYYRRYPEDVEIVQEVVNYLSESEGGGVDLPSGGILTPQGLQSLGVSFLGCYAGFERLHYILETVWDPVIVPGAPKRVSYNFLDTFEKLIAFKTNPLSALLSESIFCQGASSRWSAQRIRGEYESEFDAIRAAKGRCPVLFTGEAIFPWMFDEFSLVKKLKDAADILAEKKDWPPLYDIASLNNNKVPVAAAVYYDDMNVIFKQAMETAPQIAGIRLFITSEYLHSGLDDPGSRSFFLFLGCLIFSPNTHRTASTLCLPLSLSRNIVNLAAVVVSLPRRRTSLQRPDARSRPSLAALSLSPSRLTMRRTLRSLIGPVSGQRGFSTNSEKIVASVLFERLPVVVPKIDPVVYAFQEFSFRWQQQYRRRYPDELLDKSNSRGKGEYQIDYVPAPRITDADKKNDKKSLQRALDRRLYLLLYGTTYGAPTGKPVWHFPEKVYESEETLRQCAESALKHVIGDLSNTYFVGNAPMAHMVIQPTENSTKSPSFKRFFFKSQVIATNKFDIGKCEDFVWVTKDEVMEYFPEQAEFFKKMIIS
ncbi:Peptidase [Trema orientale]|uniref:Large ribosomal subunit protein mL46 n=1 Tax=Trema orientale TaxID=63057 RepID=A0A2P5F042_TREOI|nr:Peptidase [Trema orientale]